MSVWGTIVRFIVLLGVVWCALTPPAIAASSGTVTATVRIRPPKAFQILTGTTPDHWSSTRLDNLNTQQPQLFSVRIEKHGLVFAS